MTFVLDGVLAETFEILIRSLAVSGLAAVLASLWSVPLALKITTEEFRGKGLLTSLFNALVSIPTVVLGLTLYILLSRSGPLGFLGILYTPLAIAVGEAILITPLLVVFAVNAMKDVKEGVWELVLSLGAQREQASSTLVKEALPALITASLLAFNRAVGELGVALILGGNIRGFTRVITTTIALETSKGEFGLALSLGGGLLAVTYAITAIARRLGGAR